MKKIIVQENQKAFLFKNGRFERLLNAGKHYLFGDRKTEMASLKEPLHSAMCALDVLLSNEKIAKQT